MSSNADAYKEYKVSSLPAGAGLAALAGRAGGGVPLGPHHLQLPQLLHLHAEVQIHQVTSNQNTVSCLVINFFLVFWKEVELE